MKSREEQLQKARDYAFLLLKFRLRSEHELQGRLIRKKFNPDIVKETIAFLKEKNFLDDGIFAKSWIQSRIKKPYGIRKISHELKLKGIDKKIIDNSLKEIKEGYSEERVVNEIIRQKWDKLRQIEPQKAKNRIYAYLLRRGFSPGVIIDAINQIKTEIGS